MFSCGSNSAVTCCFLNFLFVEFWSEMFQSCVLWVWIKMCARTHLRVAASATPVSVHNCRFKKLLEVEGERDGAESQQEAIKARSNCFLSL